MAAVVATRRSSSAPHFAAFAPVHADRRPCSYFERAALLGREGLLTMTAPRAAGGEGAGHLAAFEAVAELMKGDPGAAHLVAEANFGAMGVIVRHASPTWGQRAVARARAGSPPLYLASAGACKAEWLGAGWRIGGRTRGDARLDRASIVLVSAETSARAGAQKGTRRASQRLFLLDRDIDEGLVIHRSNAAPELMLDFALAPVDRALGPKSAQFPLHPLLTAQQRLGKAALDFAQALAHDDALRGRDLGEARRALTAAMRRADQFGVADAAATAKAADLCSGLAL